MITSKVAMNIAAADSRRRSFPLRGPLPFSGANAAFGYLSLQLALRAARRKGEDSSGKGRFFHTAFGLCLNDRGGLSEKFPSRYSTPVRALQKADCTSKF